ncbi:hypothetical protein H0H87_000734 [Tephrocybe sp. NHM501043]|nr:hypothetical protein H0H87_000734 [Tephrocybe sp. NHM501043]
MTRNFLMLARIIRRSITNLSRPAPPPLPRSQQREFEQLQRAPLAAKPDPALHPDAPTPLKPDFEGDVNPLTGEQGGPKKEPVGQWGGESEGDWSFKGRVSDF